MKRIHRPFFVALDGEAIDGRYVLLGTSLDRYKLENRSGINTDEALEFLCRLGSNRHLRAKSAVFVGFYFSYDLEMIVKDLPDRLKHQLFHNKSVDYNGYRLKAIKKKFFSVRKRSDKMVPRKKKDGTIYYDYVYTNGITVFDVSGFWPGYSFVKVCKKMLSYTSDELTQGKAGRGAFTWEHYKDVKEYNRLECQLLCKVMDKVYEMLDTQGLVPNRWYGSSAVANTALKKWNVSSEMRRTIEENMTPHIYDALLCAYFGGRIEALKLGTFYNVFAYDINSAYPYIISQLWSNKGIWTYTPEYIEEPFSLWHVEFKFPKDCHFGLLPFREKSGAIKFPLRGRGWYWKPEIDAALERYPGSVKFIEGYYHAQPQTTILSTVIPDLYKRRQLYKEQGNLAEYVLKITLNSLYGKFAQKIGSADYRNFVWAGWITSATRAKLARATFGHEKQVIAFATDGIYSLVPLDLPESKDLGGWSFDHYERAHILMSGVYELVGTDKASRKIGERGFKSIVWEKVLSDLSTKKKSEIEASFFVGFNLAYNFPGQYGNKYLQFTTETKTINPANLDKRKYHFKQIKNWQTDSCESDPLKFCRDMDSAPIAKEEDFIPDAELIYRDEINEITSRLLQQAREEIRQLEAL